MLGTRSRLVACLLKRSLIHDGSHRSDPDMSEFNLTVENTYSVDDGPAKVVSEGLRAFNERVLGGGNTQQVAVYIRHDDQVVGGLLGETRWNWLYVYMLWVAEEYRKRGLGKQLLTAAEDEARKRQCHHVHLDTVEVQAPGFYSKLGYHVVATLDHFPSRLYVFEKAL
jgi:ribosomal protein S18 acetylase RimI-like enzyme